MVEKKPCILIVDDDLRMRKAIADFLIGKGYTVLGAKDGDEAMEVFYKHSSVIDLVLLDVMMPHLDGFSVLHELRKLSNLPVVMLSARGEECDQLSGFGKGADDYITKPFSPALLIARIDSLLRRTEKFSTETIVIAGLTVDLVRKRVLVDEVDIELTPKEFDLLLYLLQNKGLPLSREQILNAVWGLEYYGDVRTVDTHIKQLRSKLNAMNCRVKTIRGLGYKFEE